MNETILKNPYMTHPKEYLASLDLGTNACRLLIAEVTADGLQVVDSFIKIIRLGDELATKGHISEEATKRAISALKICSQKINAYPIRRARYIATAACRQASNRDDFVRQIYQKTGLQLEVISPAEEARLAILACADLLENTTRYAIAFDIGGGSTEVMWLELLPQKYPEIIDCISLPLGVVTVAETTRFTKDPLILLQKIRKEVAQKLKHFCDRAQIYPQLRKNNVQLIGTSGTVTTLSAIYLNLERYDRKLVSGHLLTLEMITKTISSLYAMTVEERLLHPCIGPMRSELVLGGVAIFQGIYDIFPIDPVRVADRGVREGILLDLMQT